MSRIPRGDCVDSFTTTATCEGTTIMRSFHLAHGFFLLLCWSGSCNAVAGWRTAATPIASVQHRERSLGSAWPHARQQRRCASGREQRETRRERRAERDRERMDPNTIAHRISPFSLLKGLALCRVFACVKAQLNWRSLHLQHVSAVGVPTAAEPLHPQCGYECCLLDNR